jgi:hypothetical protein
MSAGAFAASASAPPSSATPIAKMIMPRRPAPKTEAGVGKSSIARPADRPAIKQRPSARSSAVQWPAGLNLLHNPGAERSLLQRSACATASPNDPLSFRAPRAGANALRSQAGALPNSQPPTYRWPRRGALLAVRSAQGRANRDNIEQASTGRLDTVDTLSSPSEHGPGRSLCPHT